MNQFVSRAFVVEAGGNRPVGKELFIACEDVAGCRIILDFVASELREEFELPETLPIQFITRQKATANN